MKENVFPSKGINEVYVLGYNADEKFMGILGMEEGLLKLPGFMLWSDENQAQVYLDWYNSGNDEEMKQRPEQSLNIETVPFNHIVNQCIITGAILIMNATIKNEVYTIGKPIAQEGDKLSIKTMKVSPEIAKKLMKQAQKTMRKMQSSKTAKSSAKVQK